MRDVGLGGIVGPLFFERKRGMEEGRLFFGERGLDFGGIALFLRDFFKEKTDVVL